jgi:hypothetical protein
MLLAAGVVFGTALTSNQAAAPATPQQLITGKAYLNITGTAVANLTNNAKFPNSPDQLLFFPYFEWNATGDPFTAPANWADNYGGQIVGYFHPPATGDYVFYIAADDNAVLYLSPTANAADKKVIARETVWSNPRQYTGVSGGSSDLTAKDSSTYAATEWATKDPVLGGAKITLTGGQAYYIEALFKEGTGGDLLSVAVADSNFTIDPSLPIPGQYLSTDRAGGPVTIATQPQSQTVAERGSVTFQVLPDGMPPYTYQWRSNTVDIAGATGMNYTVSPVPFGANNSTYSVVVTGAEGSVTSGDATLTVTPDTTLPTVLSAKGSPNRTEVVVTFSEPIDAVTGAQTGNYQISSAGGALNVTGASVSASGTQVTLTTAQQTLGTKYTLLVSGVQDTAATPNTIAPNSRAIFIPTGRIIESGGLIVIEAENWDRNTDGIWVRDTTRGTPSGGASVVAPNGAGGGVGSRLEYDVEFAQAATYTVWIRASGDNGNDDSVWFYMDDGFGTIGEPPGRTGTDASMTGFQPQTDFVWRSDAQTGTDPFTIDIPASGIRTIALARREDGSFVDKILITTIPGYSPTGFGPPETREGAPGLPTVTVTAPTGGQTFSAGANINIAVTAAGQAGLDISRVQYTANGEVIGESTTSPFNFTWNNVEPGIYGIRATAFDEIGQATTSDSVAVTVGTPPPQALLVVGTDSNPTLNPSDAAIKARLESQGWQVTVEQAPSSTTASADGKQLVIVSSTVNSGDVADKFRDVTVPVVMWEQAVQDNFRMTGDVDGTDRGTQTAQTQINIVNNTHPLAAGLPLGLLTVVSNAQDFAYGAPSANAVVIAQMADNPARAVIYGYDTGALMIDGTTPAPARRVMLFPANNSYVLFTPEAVALFDAAVQWASGIMPPPTGAKIAFVSFHPADDDPWNAADTAGFTEAPDVGYTALLREAGHDVTRFRTTGTPDVNVLNTFDLVIISRSVPSGDYQDAPETALWNGITAPTMILGGYVIRQNRLGLMAGNDIPDTTGPIKLTVNDPDHPIFEGISLDGTGTMVNDYAVIATYTNQPQRGISVVTGDPSTGGTVLATVGAGDPAAGGLVIGEWKAGSVLANGTANTLGGDRLVFLTGSREHAANAAAVPPLAALTSEGSGIYDLTEDGAKMFLNAVDYMVGSTPDPDAPTIEIGRNASGQIVITFEGSLQSTTSLQEPVTWGPEAGTGTVVVDPSLPMKFYRSTR